MTQLMEKILSSENIDATVKKVKSNKGAGGMVLIGLYVKDIDTYFTANWASIREGILKRKYKPQAVLRVEIPKSGGGVRKLGIPTIMDRVIECIC